MLSFRNCPVGCQSPFVEPRHGSGQQFQTLPGIHDLPAITHRSKLILTLINLAPNACPPESLCRLPISLCRPRATLRKQQRQKLCNMSGLLVITHRSRLILALTNVAPNLCPPESRCRLPISLRRPARPSEINNVKNHAICLFYWSIHTDPSWFSHQ